MNPRDIKQYPIVWTDNKSQPIFVGDFRNVVITLVGTGTVSVQGTADKDVVDFTSASTLSNSYATMVIADMTAASTYATSITVSSSTKLGEVNTNLVTYVSLTRSADTVDCFVTLSDNS